MPLRTQWYLRLLLIAAGCAHTQGAYADESVGHSRQGIVGGQVDSIHDAVVSIRGCSATIIATNGQQASAITAAHCVSQSPTEVIVGADSLAPSALRLPVTQVIAHPFYRGGLFDFALLRFDTQGRDLPTIPVQATDDARPGTRVVFVGFGETDDASEEVRRQVAGVITHTDSWAVRYGQRLGGPCKGDSGGPALIMGPGEESLLAVTSYGDSTCSEYGVSGKTAPVRDRFILPFVQSQAVESCEVCRSTFESEMGDAFPCLAEGSCAQLAGCFAQCTTESCQLACAGQYPDGAESFVAWRTALCGARCPLACAANPLCSLTTACGIEVGRLSCQACIEASCCAETLICASDRDCSDRMFSSAGNAPEQLATMRSCVQRSCAAECVWVFPGTDPQGDNVQSEAQCAGYPGRSSEDGWWALAVVLSAGVWAQRRRSSQRHLAMRSIPSPLPYPFTCSPKNALYCALL